VLMIVLMAGCGSQNSAPDAKADLGCKLSDDNAKQICVTAEKENKLIVSEDPAARSGDENADASRLAEQSRTSTARVAYGVKTTTGEVAAEVVCDVNARHRAIVYATLVRGPTSKEAAQYLQDQGLCSN
jgi:hypothetical protein